MLLNILLFTVLLICVITDIRSRKIYNKIIFPSLILAFSLHVVHSGWAGLTESLLGFATGLGILLIPYLLGGMGAGDVKLLALIGAIKGAPFIFATAIYMGIIGGVIAISILLFRKGVFERLKNIFYFIFSLFNGLKIPLAIDKEGYKTTFPYGVAIAGGAVVNFFVNGAVFP
ncbi:MAG TPA: prepilin peptidase [Chondromyces sp.]|nr:prepilin peptidase [Chondromyces sp.]